MGTANETVLSTKVSGRLLDRFEAKRKQAGLSRAGAVRQAVEAWLGLPDHAKIKEAALPRVVTVPSVPTVPQAPPANTERVIPPDVVTAQVRHLHRRGEVIREEYRAGSLTRVYACANQPCDEELR